MNEFKPGLEGVVAFETEIAEPDKEGGALRYRGVDIEELVGKVPYEQVWGLLVDDSFEPGMPRAENIELPARTGSAMSDLQASTAELGGHWGLSQLIDISDEQARDDLARLSAGMISLVAQSARGKEPRVPDERVAEGDIAAERILLHRQDRGVDRGRLQRRHVGGRRRSLRPAARRRAHSRPQDARRGGAGRRRLAVRARSSRPRRADHGFRPPRL